MITSPNWIRNKNRHRRRNAAYHKERSNPWAMGIGILVGIVILVVTMLAF